MVKPISMRPTRGLHRQLAARALAILSAVTAATLPACRASDGTVYYPVIGLGIVGVKDPISLADGPKDTLSAQRVEVLGVVAAPGSPVAGIIAGYYAHQSVSASTNANALVESFTFRDGRWTITIHPIESRTPSPPLTPESPPTPPVPQP